MPGEHDEPEDILELTDEVQDEQHEEPEHQAEDDGFSIELDGDDAEPEETPVMRRIRERAEKLRLENADLKSRLNAETAPEPGKKPDLWEDCDGDPDKFERELLLWRGRVQAKEDSERRQTDAQAARQRSFERQRAGFLARASKVRDVDMDAAEIAVAQALSPEWVGAIIESSPVAERVIGALYKYPAQLQRIMDEPEGWKRMRLIWELEQKVQPNMNKRKPPEPEAETIQRGSAPLSPQTDKKLAALEKEAERTMDRSKVQAYLREKRRAKS